MGVDIISQKTTLERKLQISAKRLVDFWNQFFFRPIDFFEAFS